VPSRNARHARNHRKRIQCWRETTPQIAGPRFVWIVLNRVGARTNCRSLSDGACYPVDERSTGENAWKWPQFDTCTTARFLVLPKAARMSGNDQLATCTRCGPRIESFGRMPPLRRRRVPSDCIGCARELVPERVAEVEEMDRRWGPEHNNKS